MFEEATKIINKKYKEDKTKDVAKIVKDLPKKNQVVEAK